MEEKGKGAVCSSFSSFPKVLQSISSSHPRLPLTLPPVVDLLLRCLLFFLSSTVNIDSKPGSVGFASVLFPFVYPVRLVRVDDETGDVLRDPRTGLAVLCRPGEPGEFVGKIVKGHPSRSFDGYVNARATQKKIVGDVLRRGDLWFRSGDLLTMDEFGWMYFVDRLGDTFRWKGENVSTMEVEAVISGCLRLQDAIAYGVEVRNFSGNMCFFPCSVQQEGELSGFLTVERLCTAFFLRSHCSSSGQCPPNRGKSQTKKTLSPPRHRLVLHRTFLVVLRTNPVLSPPSTERPCIDSLEPPDFSYARGVEAVTPLASPVRKMTNRWTFYERSPPSPHF